jgi:hypothetical protein
MPHNVRYGNPLAGESLSSSGRSWCRGWKVHGNPPPAFALVAWLWEPTP